MAVLTTDLVIPSVLQDAIQGAFIGMKCLMGSPAAVVASTLPHTDKVNAKVVTVPYFGLTGELEDVGEGVSLTSKSISMSEESATVIRSGAKYNVNQWAQLAAQYADPYGKASTDMVGMVERRGDKALITVAKAELPSSMTITTANKISWDLVVDGKGKFGDEADDLALMAIHSKVKTDLYKLKDSSGRPLFVDVDGGKLGSFCGVPLIVSDRCPVTVTLSAVTETGTTPPDVTLTGTPNRDIDFRMQCTTLGARGTSVVKYSIDGGINYITGKVTAASWPLLDAAGEVTGVTVNMENAAAAVNNVWTATSTLVHQTMLIQKGALAFWYNEKPSVAVVYDGDTDSNNLTVNVYHTAHRYSRMPGKTRPGVVHLFHG